MRYSSSRKAFLSIVTAVGGAFISANASAELAALPVSDNPTTKVVTIGVMFHGYARGGYVPLGNIVFTEANKSLGVADVAPGCIEPPTGDSLCEVRIPISGFALGRHTITASYSGDQPHGANPPESLTFTVYVSELAWLPAVLKPLYD